MLIDKAEWGEHFKSLLPEVQRGRPLPALLPSRNYCAIITIIMLLFLFRFYLLYPCITLPNYPSALTGRCAYGQGIYSTELSGLAAPRGTRARAAFLEAGRVQGGGCQSSSNCPTVPSHFIAHLDLTPIIAQSSVLRSC